MQRTTDDPGCPVLDELANDAPRLAVAYLLLAVPMLVIGVGLAVALTRYSLRSVIPRWRHCPTRTSGLEVFAFVSLAFVVLPSLVRITLESSGLFRQWNLTTESEQSRAMTLLTAPLWILGLIMWRWRIGRSTSQFKTGQLIYGIAGFLVLTPVILLLNLLAAAIHILGGGAVEKHPLTAFTPGSLPDTLVLLVSASVVAPVMEELIFRGLLLSWCRERVERSLGVFVLALVVLIYQRGVTFLPAVLLMIDLGVFMALSMFGRQIWKRWPHRMACSIFATASLFAVLHAGVWPTPWPLLFFGIGLGIMTARSGTVLPAIITHSLFNTVSVIFLLRGGA